MRRINLLLFGFFASILLTSCDENYPGPPCDSKLSYVIGSSTDFDFHLYRQGEMLAAVRTTSGQDKPVTFRLAEEQKKIVETDSSGICSSTKRWARYLVLTSDNGHDTLVIRFLAPYNVGVWHRDRGVFFENVPRRIDSVYSFVNGYGPGDSVRIKYSNDREILEFESTHYNLKWTFL